MNDQIYVDYVGSGVYQKHQIENSFKNKNFENGDEYMISDEQIRLDILSFFNADPLEYAVFFTSGASTALKFVGENFPFSKKSKFIFTKSNHNSVLGIREFALEVGAQFKAIVDIPETNDDIVKIVNEMEDNKEEEDDNNNTYHLFAFPAMCNFSGVKYPLSLIDLFHSFSSSNKEKFLVLLDAAAYVSTSPLDLRKVKPDFVSLSFYKMFGYPTGVGALLVHRTAAAVLVEGMGRFHGPLLDMWAVYQSRAQADADADGRRSFSAAAPASSSSSSPSPSASTRHPSIFPPHFVPPHDLVPPAFGLLRAAVELDGAPSPPTRTALAMGLAVLRQLGVARIQRHTHALTDWAFDELRALRHSTGRPLLEIHGEHERRDAAAQGPVLNFNVRLPAVGKPAVNSTDTKGGAASVPPIAPAFFGFHDIAELAAVEHIHMRTGCACNPGACYSYTEVPNTIIRTKLSVMEGNHCGAKIDMVDGYMVGAIRVSFGYLTTFEEAASVVQFFRRFVNKTQEVFDEEMLALRLKLGLVSV